MVDEYGNLNEPNFDWRLVAHIAKRLYNNNTYINNSKQQQICFCSYSEQGKTAKRYNCRMLNTKFCQPLVLYDTSYTAEHDATNIEVWNYNINNIFKVDAT